MGPSQWKKLGSVQGDGMVRRNMSMGWALSLKFGGPPWPGPPPQTLPAGRDLNGFEVPRGVSVQEMKLVEDGRMDRKLRRRHVDGADHLLYRLTVGGKRRRMLILAAHIERTGPADPDTEAPLTILEPWPYRRP